MPAVERHQIAIDKHIERLYLSLQFHKVSPLQKSLYDHMTTSNFLTLTHFRSSFSTLPLGAKAICRRLSNVMLVVACVLLASASANAQQAKSGPTLVPGSEVDLSAVTSAEWIQGKGPDAFEPNKVYIFECWATWCGPCIAMIPHVNHLHGKYYDQGLRVHGMNSWEGDKNKDKAKSFVKEQGAGMSYPVAFAAEGSAFETKWLGAAGVASIPHAFVVRNGKLLLSTEAVRLTDSLVEAMLSGDEGAQQAAATIKAAQEAAGETEKLISKLSKAERSRDVQEMTTALQQLEKIDPNHPELEVLKIRLTMARQEWPAAITALNELPSSYAKNSFLMSCARRIVQRHGQGYPTDFLKAVTPPYREYIIKSGDKIGPNHFAYLTILHWKIDDKKAAMTFADKGIEVAMNFARASEGRTAAFKRFAKSVKDGSLPRFSELMEWHHTAVKKADDK